MFSTQKDVFPEVADLARAVTDLASRPGQVRHSSGQVRHFRKNIFLRGKHVNFFNIISSWSVRNNFWGRKNFGPGWPKFFIFQSFLDVLAVYVGSPRVCFCVLRMCARSASTRSYLQRGRTCVASVHDGSGFRPGFWKKVVFFLIIV